MDARPNGLRGIFFCPLRWKECNGCNGFTLIELLLSVSLGAIILTAVYAAYTGTLRSSQRVEYARAEIQAWRFFVERLRADLVSLQLSYGAEPAKGEAQGFTFNILESGSVPVLVRYRWQQSGGKSAIHREVNRNGAQSTTAVYEGVTDVGFRYFTLDGWQNRFDGAEAFPLALECKVTVGGRQRQITLGIEVEKPPPSP